MLYTNTFSNIFKEDCWCKGPLKTSQIRQPKPHISDELKKIDFGLKLLQCDIKYLNTIL